MRIPPASHLAFLNTLIIHPAFTTRAEAADRVDASCRALHYLRNVAAIAGPVNANFTTAFQFRESPKWSRRGGDSAEGSTDDHDEVAGLRGQVANQGSIWERGDNFWSVAGWAFNCSVLYPHRWKHWKLWLGYMLDILESDWEERARIDAEAAERASGTTESTLQHDALALKYINQLNDRSNGIRYIVKALFANADKSSLAMFQSVFDKETKSTKDLQLKRKRADLDLENDKFGDYLDESFSSGGSEPPTPEKRAPQRPQKLRRVPDQAEYEATILRLRLFKLVSKVLWHQRNMHDLSELYESLAGQIQQLPVPAFGLFVNYHSSPLLDISQVTLMKELFRRLLQPGSRQPSCVDKATDQDGALSPKILQHCYLPYTANTTAVDDNAKVSLLVENAILLMWDAGNLKYSPELRVAATEGVANREAKIKAKKGSKARPSAKMTTLSSTDTLALSILNASAERISILCDVMEQLPVVLED